MCRSLKIRERHVEFLGKFCYDKAKYEKKKWSDKYVSKNFAEAQ